MLNRPRQPGRIPGMDQGGDGVLVGMYDSYIVIGCLPASGRELLGLRTQDCPPVTMAVLRNNPAGQERNGDKRSGQTAG